MTTLRTYLLLGVIIAISSLGFNTTHASNFELSLVCGDSLIEGTIETSSIEKTDIEVIIENDGGFVEKSVTSLHGSEEYKVEIDPTNYEEGLYTITLNAILGEKTSTWSYKTFLGEECDSMSAVKERIVVYANEAKEYFDNVENEQYAPSVFLATGLRNWIDETVEKTGKRFAGANASTYHTLPDWTVGPFEQPEDYPSFEEHYALIPDKYRNADGYIHFKGLLVPVVLPNGAVTEEALLTRLNSGALLAPETPSFDSIGNVKILYSHSLSLIDSPFAGVGSYLSLYSNAGDEVTIYVKKGYVSYEKRTYTVKHKLQITPEQTKILTGFKKPGVDSFALITCRDGDVIGSTQGREVLLIERNFHELEGFKKAMVMVHNIPSLSEQAKQFDRYLVMKDLDDEAVAILVKELEKAEKNGENPLHSIATYGKYMASYGAIYN